MTFSEKTKNEIISKPFSSTCCQISALSAFIRGTGTIVAENGQVGFEIVNENFEVLKFYTDLLSSLYGETSKVVAFKDKLTGKEKYSVRFLTKTSLYVLTELGILSIKDGSVVINLTIDKYLTENDCCKKAYIFGAFTGSGSVTVPKANGKTVTGYHLEFVFSNYQTALDFSNLLSSQGFLPKLITRKENIVVYFKNSEEIADLLFFLGATKSSFELRDIIIQKDIRNETNRRINCEMANIDKQITASKKQTDYIKSIDETIGLDTLNSQLKSVANARLENPEATLEELASMLNITKSCLNHRLRKIAEIAKNCTL